MKRIASFLAAVMVICSLTACSSKDSGSSDTTHTAEKLSNIAYKQEKLSLPDKAQVIYGAVPSYGGNKVYLLGAADTSPAFWIADSSFSAYERVELTDFDIGITYSFGVSIDGEFADFVIHADYGDLPTPDPTSPDYDEEMYDAAAEYSIRLVVYGSDGQIVSDSTCDNYKDAVDKGTMLGGMVFDGKHAVVNIGGSYEVFSVNGDYLGELTAGENETICGISSDSTGSLVCAVEIENGTIELRGINAENCTLESGSCYVLGESVQQIESGAGDYSLFIRTRSTIYGLNSENDELTALCDVNATGINVNNIISFFLGDDGKITICTTDYSKWQSKLIRFTECDPSELGDIKKLRIGLENEFCTFDQVIDEFSDSMPNVQIERVVYERTGDDPFSPQFTQFDEDALSGNLPDIIVIQAGGRFCNTNLAEKGALIDLMPYMKKDANVKPEDIFPNLLESICTDGKVFSLPNRFYVDMGYVCKKKLADKLIHGDFNFSTYMDVLENIPDGMNRYSFDENDSKWGRRGVASDTWWIDDETASCRFDSDSYIRYLRYCTNGSDNDTSESFYADPLNPTDEEIDQYFINEKMQYKNDKTLFKQFQLGNFENYMCDIKGDFGGDEVVYLGLPREDGAHTYVDISLDCLGITKDSKCPDEAWSFISFVEGYDYEGSGWSLMGFPITEKGFYDLAERMRFDDRPQYPEIKENGYSWFNGKEFVSIGALTDEDIEFIHERLINAEVPPKSELYRDNEYYEILDEEINALFAGESTPEQCAKYLQNRIGIYLSERS